MRVKPSERYLTVKQIADDLDVTIFTIYNELKRGRLKGIRVGSIWRIPKENYQDYISGGSRQNG